MNRDWPLRLTLLTLVVLALGTALWNRNEVALGVAALALLASVPASVWALTRGEAAIFTAWITALTIAVGLLFAEVTGLRDSVEGGSIIGDAILVVMLAIYYGAVAGGVIGWLVADLLCWLTPARRIGERRMRRRIVLRSR